MDGSRKRASDGKESRDSLRRQEASCVKHFSVISTDPPDCDPADYPSDSYATGQSLYALGLAGRTGSDAAVQKSWQYLLATQKADGSWPGVSKKPGVKENPIILYWGSAWATIGLARTLP
jgi:hypothetical protein